MLRHAVIVNATVTLVTPLALPGVFVADRARPSAHVVIVVT
jgi:hypothetical protein